MMEKKGALSIDAIADSLHFWGRNGFHGGQSQPAILDFTPTNSSDRTYCNGLRFNMPQVFCELVQATWEDAHKLKRKVCKIDTIAAITE
jgi:hypothetical protein